MVKNLSGKIRGISPLVGTFSGVSNLSPIDLHFSQVSSLSLDADHILAHSGSISLGFHELLETDGSSRSAVRGDMGLLKRFNDIILDVVLWSGRSFVWTSFQLHKNVTSQSHVDEGVRTSLLLAWGEFSGSEFVTFPNPLCERSSWEQLLPCGLHASKATLVDRDDQQSLG